MANTTKSCKGAMVAIYRSGCVYVCVCVCVCVVKREGEAEMRAEFESYMEF